MIESPLCIIPARGGSKRLANKNRALVLGKSLVAYAIEVALASNIFSRICVSSEDDKILKIADTYGEGLSLKRPVELSGDDIGVAQVCEYILSESLKQGEKYEAFAILLPTSPLRTSADIKSAYELLQEPKTNCVMSLVAYSHPPQRALSVTSGRVKPYFGYQFMKRTQELEQLYRHDGTVIFAKTQAFLENKGYWMAGTIPYYVPENRSVDIDTEQDLEYAEFLLNKNKR